MASDRARNRGCIAPVGRWVHADSRTDPHIAEAIVTPK